MSAQNPKVDGYIRKNKRWNDELLKLRAIILDSGLTEDIKWRTPCYTLDNKNILFIGSQKDCCVLSFLKGALLKDPHAILQLPGPNTQAARVIRFASLNDILAVEPIIRDFIRQAITIEKSGEKVVFKNTSQFAIPPEFQNKLDQMPDLKAAFDRLTPGRQRAYLLHFSSAKQSKTRASRVEKLIPQILAGKGIDD